ncbi:MAG: S41 family peptidase, partial [Bacteroidota bacterium]|nr:S41 family peptidase [Bacteroidota bacterium]
MKIKLLLSLICLILIISSLTFAENKSGFTPQTYSLEDLQADFATFKAAIQLYHPKLYTNRSELDRLLSNQTKLLKDKMTELQFYRILAPIVAKLNCGHTNLHLSTEYEHYLNINGKFFPLWMKVISDKVYVYQDPFDTGIPLGAEITEINGRPMGGIINTLLNNISADGSNLTRKYYIITSQFNGLYYYVVETPDEFTVKYIHPLSHQVIQTTIQAILGEKITQKYKSQPTLHLYSQQFEQNYAVLTIRSFAFYDEPSTNKFKDFINCFFTELRSKKIENLILDLRNNGGGSPDCSAYLFSYLIHSPQPYFDNLNLLYPELIKPIPLAKDHFQGKLFTLINGGSFSSTGHLCS